MREILKGVIASKGKVEGTVFLLNDERDLPEFTPGLILVTRSTKLSYMKTLGEAAGIITDIGGITYHAAIAAREFKIPCIVGTGNASQLLKTGQKIILDADNGVVFEN